MVERIYKCDLCGTVMNPNDSYDLTITLSPHRAHQLSEVWNPSAQLCSECANKFWNNAFKLKDGDGNG